MAKRFAVVGQKLLEGRPPGTSMEGQKEVKISEDASQKIKNLSLLCAAYVVSIHIRIPGGLGSSTWFAHQLITEGLSRIAVPFFFVVSGFFLAAHFGEKGWWGREIKKRIPSLVVPFFIWSFLSLVTPVPLNIIADLSAHRPLGTSIEFLHDPNWMQMLGVDLTEFPILNPLWYLRCLFLFVIVSPAISFLVSRLGCGWLIFCFMFSILHGHGLPWPELNQTLHRGFSSVGFFYFSVGIFLQQHRPFKTTRSIAVWAAIIGLSLLALKITCFYNTWRFQAELGILSLPFLMYATWHFMPTAHWPGWLTSCTFPIYLMHPLFFPYVDIGVKNLYVGLRSPLMLPMFNFLVGLFGSIIVANCLRKYFPRASRVLFGGR